MFTEVDFDSDDDRTLREVGASGEQNTDFGFQANRINRSGDCSAVVSLHRPGDDEFSCVAGGSDDFDGAYDARLISGDSWLGGQCHCVRCEVVYASEKISHVRKMMRSDKALLKSVAAVGNKVEESLLVILLDLDNYGFNQFKAIPPPRSSDADFNLLDHLFLWCFFGSCFSRHHGVLPDAEVVCRAFEPSKKHFADGVSPGADGKSVKGRRKKSVWQRLVAKKRVHFTPCGGQQQAADGVMMQVAKAMTHMPLVVVSGDLGLLTLISESRRAVGRKAMREALEYEFASHLEVVNVLEHGRKFAPVWQALEEIARRTVCRR
ncbi:hypothetical protein ERJ75_001825700 [Trypanosoma vivax]|uniref:NYN domain-containing protein n=1 Tax=Trypanosoma vivax (strain Y486) TaxID=1055687 RepID=G0U8Y9_TRYVY|nr:hypothetical protein TRVL_03478 [Trypanosoma vivax]KAH8603421.1 hypothetical protein ERJ75_001825700 [Trypanosoma vivax]CCC54071.1 conserved hypothetical protein [Trypanosoma vivax Y486]